MATHYITDAEARHNNSPSTFPIPSKADRESVEEFDLVLVALNVIEPPYTEWVWIQATAARRGKLQRDPRDPERLGFRAGDEIEFRPKHIIEIIRAGVHPVPTVKSATAAPAA